MEYAGYKNYVCTRRMELADKMSGLKKNIKSRLASSHKKRKEIKRQLKVIQEKRQSPLTVDDYSAIQLLRCFTKYQETVIIIFINAAIRSCH